jgi:hypothetical protein
LLTDALAAPPGFCQKLLDKATLLDRRVDVSRVGTMFGALLAEAGEEALCVQECVCRSVCVYEHVCVRARVCMCVCVHVCTCLRLHAWFCKLEWGWV